MDNQSLVNFLAGLPIEIGKVSLWLVHRDAKPMASIVLTFNWDEDEEKQKEVLSWFNQVNIFYTVSQRFSNTLHISKAKNLLETNKEHELSDDKISHLVRGKLYGFPEAVVEIYSEEIVKGSPRSSKKIVHPPMVEEIRNTYWYPYVEYMVRSGNELEDSLAAKKWADLARKEIPEIATEFENKTIAAMEDFRLRPDVL